MLLSFSYYFSVPQFNHKPLFFIPQGLNERKNVPQETVTLMLHNLSTYLSCVSLESSVPMWTNILTQFDIFFRRLPSALPNACNVEPVLTIIITLLKVYVITNVRVRTTVLQSEPSQKDAIRDKLTLSEINNNKVNLIIKLIVVKKFIVLVLH